MIFLLLSLCLFPVILSSCSFTQTCPDPKSLETCNIPVPVSTEPFATQFSQPFQCPDMDPNQVCCNDDQHNLMAANFKLIDASFGSGNGGCDLCAANLKRLWCQFTCSPKQSSFLFAYSNIYVTDPTDTSQQILVLNSTMVLNNDLTCQLFESCKKTPFVTQVSAMQTAAGFIKFQGKNSVVKAKMLINIGFDNESGLKTVILPCESQAKDDIDSSGYPITSNCTCNNCDGCCSNQKVTIPEVSSLEGFDFATVGGFYLTLLAISIVQYLIKKK